MTNLISIIYSVFLHCFSKFYRRYIFINIEKRNNIFDYRETRKNFIYLVFRELQCFVMTKTCNGEFYVSFVGPLLETAYSGQSVRLSDTTCLKYSFVTNGHI